MKTIISIAIELSPLALLGLLAIVISEAWPKHSKKKETL